MADVVLLPETVLISDVVLARLKWTLDMETERVRSLIDDEPGMRETMLTNGWTDRMVAWQNVLRTLVDRADFDDARGREPAR